VVVFFQNSELQEIAYQPSKNIKEVYTSVVAERMISLKSKIARELRQNGIQTVLTVPSELSVNTINKYLELKAKGSI
jgi:isopentenyl phosphate kinase